MYSSKEKSASRTRGLCLTTAILAAGLTSGAMAASNLAMTAADTTIGVGGKLVVTVSLSGDAVDGVGAQFVIKYDATKLSLDQTSGNRYEVVSGSPLDLELYESHSTSGGVGIYKLALGTSTGSSDVSIDGDLITMTFTPSVDFCGVSGLVYYSSDGGFTTMLSDDTGSEVTLDPSSDLGSVTRDTAAPSLVGVPSNESYWADADGSNAAAVTVTQPTGSDSCDGSVDITYSRSNGSGLSSFAAGVVTTITWTATDDCGNTATSTTTVDVSADSLALVTAAEGGAFAAPDGDPFTRGIAIAVSKSSVSDSDVQTVTMDDAGSGASSRAEGSANFLIAGSTDWASGCALVRDPLHTLRRAITIDSLAGSGSHGGRNYNSRFAVDANDSASEYLKVGNADGNTVIDILDFGKFVSQRGSSLSPNTTASSSGTHTDFNASGVVNNADLSFLAVNFFSVDESCSGSYTGDAPRARISVKELRRTGQGHLVAADINGDGWVDTTDMALMLQGQSGQPVRTGSSSSGSVAW